MIWPVSNLPVIKTLIVGLAWTLECMNSGTLEISGVSSLAFAQHAHNPDGHLQQVFAGTKRGSIHRLVVENNGSIRVTEELKERADHDGSAKVSLPIFSMAFDSKGSRLFCGGGDRYVSVWKRNSENEWQFQQRLGPHTGWVRDVFWESESQRLHSLGCNCIETWLKRETKSNEQHLQHWKKASISNSPDLGATLSGDLICLCPMKRGLFFAGGVDGRIHLWDSLSMSKPVWSISAHQGRINAMVYLDSMEILFSASHDGTIKSWVLYRQNNVILDHPAEILPIQQHQRVTSLYACTESEIIFFGTQKGQVGVLTKGTAAGNLRTMEATYQLSDNLVVNAICALLVEDQNHNPCHIVLVGHSRGIDTLLFSSMNYS